MEKIRRGWTAMLAAGAASIGMASAAHAQEGASRAPDIGRMDQIVKSYIDNKQFMGSVLVARGGRVLLDKGLRQP
jgi:hypothetical protein